MRSLRETKCKVKSDKTAVVKIPNIKTKISLLTKMLLIYCMWLNHVD